MLPRHHRVHTFPEFGIRYTIYIYTCIPQRKPFTVLLSYFHISPVLRFWLSAKTYLKIQRLHRAESAGFQAIADGAILLKIYGVNFSVSIVSNYSVWSKEEKLMEKVFWSVQQSRNQMIVAVSWAMVVWVMLPPPCLFLLLSGNC